MAVKKKNKRKLRNIFWIVTEGNRTFDGNDKYSKARVYDKLSPEYVRFTNTIASATSTVMSTTSFFTGRFAYELFYAYGALKGLIHYSYLHELVNQGYTLNGTFFCREGIKFYEHSIINLFKLKKDEYKSKNELVFSSFLSIMKNKFNKSGPNFVYVHLAPLDTGSYVEKIISYLKKNGLYDDSFVMVSSDHGYTDYGRIHSLGWLRRPNNHSLYVTEDCYKANLLMSLPKQFSNVKGKGVTTQVALFDVLETVFDYLGIKYKADNKKAVSLRRLIEGNDKGFIKKMNERMLRVDNRYMTQNYKKTVVRNNHHELFIDYGKYSFFKRLSNKGPWDKRLIRVNKRNSREEKAFKELKRFYKKTETEALCTTKLLLEEDYNKSVMNDEIKKIKNKNVAVYNYSSRVVLDFLIPRLRKKNDVKVVDMRSLKRTYEQHDLVLVILNNPYYYPLDPLVKFCKKTGLKLLIYDNKFNKMKYEKYSVFKGAFHNWRAYVGHNLIEKIVIFFVLCFLQMLELHHLKNNRENRYPITP